MNLFSRDEETIAKRSFEAGYVAAQPTALPDPGLAALAQQGTELRTKIAHHSRGGLEQYLRSFGSDATGVFMTEAGDTLEALLDALPALVYRVQVAEAAANTADAFYKLVVQRRQEASDNYDWALEEHGEKSAEATAAYQGWNELDNLYLTLIEKGAVVRA